MSPFDSRSASELCILRSLPPINDSSRSVDIMRDAAIVNNRNSVAAC